MNCQVMDDEFLCMMLGATKGTDGKISASDVSEFSLVLDIMADDTGKIMDIENTTGGVSAGFNEPEIVSIKAKADK